MGKLIAVLGDLSSHGGTLITTNQDNTVKVKGINVCVEGCLHSCPLPGHGITPVVAVTTASFVNGKLIITQGAVAGCGAIITPLNRDVEVE
jgi:uncharacterized Zn-binding protein involved in type VI secretion